MMLACNCLNIIIEPELNDLLKVTKESLDLTESEKKDSFFNQEIQQTKKLKNVVNKVSALIANRKVGYRWTVYHCINCNMHTHAIHQNNEAAFVLISEKLLDNEAIASVKNSNYYSPVFDIRIMECPTESRKSYDIMPSDSEAIISSLRQRVNEFINIETAAMENRIRKYTEEQHAALEQYKDRVYKEHHLLKMKILEHKLNSSSDDETSTNIDKKLPQNHPKSSVPDNVTKVNSPLVSKPKAIINDKSSTRRQNGDVGFSRSVSAYDYSYDAEMFFPLEDMHDEPTLQQSDFEESDQEDLPKDENSEISHRQKQSTQLAKSLPVNIPVFLSAYQNHLNEDKDDDLPDESMDIAASIKALAKSIQGGTVFGELPRSRFSSKI